MLDHTRELTTPLRTNSGKKRGSSGTETVNLEADKSSVTMHDAVGEVQVVVQNSEGLPSTESTHGDCFEGQLNDVPNHFATCQRHLIMLSPSSSDHRDTLLDSTARLYSRSMKELEQSKETLESSSADGTSKLSTPLEDRVREKESSNGGMVDIDVEKEAQAPLEHHFASVGVRPQLGRPSSGESDHGAGKKVGENSKVHVNDMPKHYTRSRRRISVLNSNNSGLEDTTSVSSVRLQSGDMKELVHSKGIHSASNGAIVDCPVSNVFGRKLSSSTNRGMVELGIRGCRGGHIAAGKVQAAVHNVESGDGTNKNCDEGFRTHSSDMPKWCTRKRRREVVFNSSSSGSMDTTSESPATSHGGAFKALAIPGKTSVQSEKGVSEVLNTALREKWTRDVGPSTNRHTVDLNVAAGIHDCQEESHVAAEEAHIEVHNLESPPCKEFNAARLSSATQSFRSRPYRRPRHRQMVTSNNAGRSTDGFGDSVHPSEHIYKNPSIGEFSSAAQAQMALVRNVRPHQRSLTEEGSRSCSGLLACLQAGRCEEEMESSEKATAYIHEGCGEGQTNQGSLGAYVGHGHTPFALGRENMHNQLPNDRAILVNAVGSPSRQDDSAMATVQMVGGFPSGQGPSVQQKRRLPLRIENCATRDLASSGQCCSLRRQISGHKGIRSRRGQCSVASQRPFDVVDVETSRSTVASINLEDDEDSERARQIALDESLAKLLQEEYNSEAAGGTTTFVVQDDAQVARMVQEEEDARSMQHTAGSSLLTSPFPHVVQDDAQVARMLQEEEDARSMQHTAGSSRLTSPFPHTRTPAMQTLRREMQRVYPSARSHADRSSFSSSRMRILRGLHDRSIQRQTRGHLLGGAGAMSNESMLHFPEGVDMDPRLNILAAIESAFQDSQSLLEQIDRDFNENDYEMLLALDSNNDGRNGASRDKIERLPISTIQPTDVYEELCSICLEKPIVGDKVRRLPCMHGFHQQCIDAWLERQANCPICKGSV